MQTFSLSYYVTLLSASGIATDGFTLELAESLVCLTQTLNGTLCMHETQRGVTKRRYLITGVEPAAVR